MLYRAISNFWASGHRIYSDTIIKFEENSGGGVLIRNVKGIYLTTFVTNESKKEVIKTLLKFWKDIVIFNDSDDEEEII